MQMLPLTFMVSNAPALQVLKQRDCTGTPLSI